MIIKQGLATPTMDECREKMLTECDPPEFEDCIRLDRKCYDVARELKREGKLTKSKQKLLEKQVIKHAMAEMFGHGWWRRK